MQYAVGVDVGGTNIKAVAMSPAGEIVGRTAGPTEDGNGVWAARIKERIGDLEVAIRAPATERGAPPARGRPRDESTSP